MKEEAEKFAEEDKKKKESIETVNQAESLVYQTEKTLEEHGEKVPEEIKQPIQDKIDSIKKLLEAEQKDIETIKTQVEELNKEIQKIGEAMYQAEQAAGAQDGPETSEAGSQESADDSDSKKTQDAEGEVIDQ